MQAGFQLDDRPRAGLGGPGPVAGERIVGVGAVAVAVGQQADEQRGRGRVQLDAEGAVVAQLLRAVGPAVEQVRLALGHQDPHRAALIGDIGHPALHHGGLPGCGR